MKRLASICTPVLVGLLLLAGAASAASMQEKAESIMLKKVDLDDVPFDEVVKFLRDQSKQLDPEHVGVNFLVYPPSADSGDYRQRKITLSFSNMTLAEVIHYACMAAGIQYVIEDSAVVIADRHTPLSKLVTKAYKVRPGVFDTPHTRTTKPLSLSGKNE